MTTDQFDILLVEDNPADARLAVEALMENSLKPEVHVARDGVEAMAFLRHQGRYTRMPRPDLVVLDLNLPKKNGRHVLAEIKADAELSTIPVVVLTTSQSEEDVSRCYGLKTNSYVVKPMDFEEFITAVKSIHSFWLETATLPGGLREAR